MQLRNGRRHVFLAAALCALLAAPVSAQTFTPYSTFNAMSQGQLVTLQVKLTSFGPQQNQVFTRLMTSDTGTPDLSLFVPFRRPAFDYVNDDLAPVTFTATPAELEALIDNVGALSGVTDGGVDTSGVLAFGLLNTDGGTVAFESILDVANATALLEQMRGSVAPTPICCAERELDRMGCELGLLPPGSPLDVSGDVTVEFSGLRIDRITGLFVGRVKVTNISGSPLQAPLSLMVEPAEPLVVLANEDGFTCRAEPVGQPFVNLPTSGDLGPGQMVEAVVHFSNPDLDAVALVPKVFAGPGPR